ncbi:hypothetical protein CsatB_018535 [Cannabis sativa]|uniref:Seed maturation protein n=2 Tax=Cannabis sativa TaxID=3483 RepID=A0A7J6E628_CANSA|nr:SEED MATURATION PROTEIN 1 [Cannabis sativa]KAF4353895.1 hypothetical protein G4B88_009373 [Cannabis sativa]KAF4365612.1 hypothetical protein F8388_007445 [Cannabis sativa]KAF4390438.1 hypothetical protein G4B88_024444 [Cannabis sativa]
MAKSKDDIKYATSQARLNEDEAVRVAYKHGTPLEGGKIADSQPLHLFSSVNPKHGQDTNQSSSDTKTNTKEGGEEHNTRRSGNPPVLDEPK